MNDHRLELRDRVIKDSYCVEPGCQYEGQEAVQGHCHSVLDAATDRLLAHMEAEAESSLAFYRDQHATGSPQEYIKTLEAMYVCAMMNWRSALDELIRLRRENAALKLPR